MGILSCTDTCSATYLELCKSVRCSMLHFWGMHDLEFVSEQLKWPLAEISVSIGET